MSGKEKNTETTQRNCQAVFLDSRASFDKLWALDLILCGLIFSFLKDETDGVIRKYHKDTESCLMFKDKIYAFLDSL